MTHHKHAQKPAHGGYPDCSALTQGKQQAEGARPVDAHMPSVELPTGLEWSRAQRTEQAEPVAQKSGDGKGVIVLRPADWERLPHKSPLYAHPPASTAQDKEKQG